MKKTIAVEKAERELALQRALEYYQVEGVEKPVNFLRRVVFANWLEEHKNKQFKPMLLTGA